MALYDVTPISDSIALTDALLRERVLYDVVTAVDSALAQIVETLGIANAHMLTNKSVRIDFTSPAALNDAIVATSSYAFLSLTPGGSEVIPQLVRLPPGQVPPRFVTIETTEHTNDNSYSVQLSNALRGQLGEVGGGDPFVYTGIGAPPAIKVVIAKSATTAIVFFTETIKDNPSARNISNYGWNNGLSTVAVLSVGGDRITLQTTPQVPGILYTLTIFGTLTAEISDTIEMSDAGELKLTELEDAAHVADSIAIATTISTVIADSAAVSDSVVRSASSRRTFNDTVATSDQIRVALTYQITKTDSVDLVDGAEAYMGTGNPYTDIPATPNAFDDEFLGGTPDLASRGWSVKTFGGTTLTRGGAINPWDATGPTGNTYWSSIVGSFLLIQFPVGSSGVIFKSITLSAGDTYFARIGSNYRLDSGGSANFQEVGFYANTGGTPDTNNRIYVSVYETATSMNMDMARTTTGSTVGTSRALYAPHDIRGVRYASGTSYFPFSADSANGQSMNNSPSGAIAAASVAYFAVGFNVPAGGTTPNVHAIDFIRKKTSNAWIAG